MGIITLFQSARKIQKLREEAKLVLSSVGNMNSEMTKAFQDWSKTYRLNTTAVSSFIASQLCYLEGQEFNENRRRVAYLGSAAACISDDIIDRNTSADPKAFRFLDSSYHLQSPQNPNQRLFYHFHGNLENILPRNFKDSFENLIRNYNLWQEYSAELKREISRERILEIKNATGGYPILLLHRMMFPNKGDLSDSFMPNYNINELPKTETPAIFNYGALISRLDDLSDKVHDLIDSRKSLSTEGLVSWNSFSRDLDYVQKGLDKFYPRKNVSTVMKFYQSTRSIGLVNLIMDKISKPKHTN